MITLLSTDKLIAYMAEAKNTTEPTYDVSSYVNKNAETDITENTKFGSLNSTTDVDLATSPAAGYNTNITHIILCNLDVIAHNIIIAKDVSGTDTILFKIYLEPNQSWSYPIHETKEIKVINAKTNVGRTVTTQTDTLLITDVGTKILAKYTAVGIQEFTIPKATYTIGDKIKIKQLGNIFKILIEDGAEQTINSAIYSNGVNNDLELEYIEDDSGKEVWCVTGGRITSYMYPATIRYDGLMCASETTDYIVEFYKTSPVNTVDASSYGTLIKIINKNTLQERSIVHFSLNTRGLRYSPLMDNILSNDYFIANSASTSRRIDNAGILYRDVYFAGNNNATPATMHNFGYTKSGETRMLVGVTQSAATLTKEYKYVGGALSDTARTITTSNLNNTMSATWDGVDCTGASTAYIYYSGRITGIYKVDIYDLSIVGTLAVIGVIYFNETPIDGKFWYTRATKIGYHLDDLSYNEYDVGITVSSIYYVTAIYDAVNGKFYCAECNGYRIVIFDIATASVEATWDISADLNSCLIQTMTFLPSQRLLTVYGNKVAEVSSYENITIQYII